MEYLIKSWEVKGSKKDKPYERIIKLLVSPEGGVVKTKSLMIGLSLVPRGSKTDRHSHTGVEELMYIMAGRGKCYVGDKEYEVVPETAIFVPGETEHQLINTSDETLKIFFCMASTK